MSRNIGGESNAEKAKKPCKYPGCAKLADGGTHDEGTLMSLCVSCHEKMNQRGRNAFVSL